MQRTQSPVILQASAGARKYAGEPCLRHMVLAAVEAHPDIPVVLHQDHGASPAVCQQAIHSGFTSVMMDGSLLEDAKNAAREIVEARFDAFGCAGQAARIRPVPLEAVIQCCR